MAKIRTFFHSLKNSLVNPGYYQDILKAHISFSFKFFFAFCLFFGLVWSSAVSLTLLPAVNGFIAKFTPYVYDMYPKELTITSKNSKISINQPSPYFIPLKLDIFTDQKLPDSAVTNLLVIDTGSDNPLSDIKQYQTLALLTSDVLVINSDDRMETRAYSLQEMNTGDFSFDYSHYQRIIDGIMPLAKYIGPLMVLLTYLFFLVFFPATKLLHLAVFSLLSMGVSAVFKPRLEYRQAFQIGLHAFIWPTLVVDVLKLSGVTLNIPFFYSLVFMVFFLIILTRLEKNPKPHPAQTR